MCNKFEKHIQLEKSQTALECLSENIDLSNQQLKKIMHNGAVWLENSYGINRIRRAKKMLRHKDWLHFYYNIEIQNEKPLPARLISDEGDYSVWDKPCGMYSQGTKWGDHCSIYRWAENNLQPQRPAFIVHRLDKSANGLIILAHKKKVAAKFGKIFENRGIYKKYRVVVEGELTSADLPEKKLPCEISNILDDKPAISEILSFEYDKINFQTTVELNIKTGRKHQIRRHLSGLGFPVVGDRLYGANNLKVDLQLSSIELAFICPVTSVQKKFKLESD
jgi:tRNA pseudouridine32 synthase/23S rRNA pseudouridine746 synthase